jgi:hypothetical protein
MYFFYALVMFSYAFSSFSVVVVVFVTINLKSKVSSTFIHCCKAVVLVERKSSKCSSLIANSCVPARVAGVCGC